jgi:formate-dependent nitrite reductase membrane component NrfD
MVLIARGAESRAIVIAIRALELGKLLGLPQDEIEIRFDPQFQQVTHSPQSSEPKKSDVSASPSLEEITADIGEGLKTKVTASKDAVKDAAISYLYLAITLVVLLPIACIGLVTGVGALMITKQIVGESAVAVWGTVTVLGLLIPAICVCNANRLLPKPTYFGESRGFLIAVISSSWLVGVICSAV